MIKRYVASLSLAALASAAPAWAEWQVADNSRIQFVSIKNNTIGEDQPLRHDLRHGR